MLHGDASQLNKELLDGSCQDVGLGLHTLAGRWRCNPSRHRFPRRNRRSLGQVPPGLLHGLYDVPDLFYYASMATDRPQTFLILASSDDNDSHDEDRRVMHSWSNCAPSWRRRDRLVALDVITKAAAA
jgi:hypothetical protein